MMPTFATAHTFCASAPTNTGIFSRSLKLFRESRTLPALSISKKKIGGNHAFSEIIKFQLYEEKKAKHCFVFYCFFGLLRLNYNP